MDDKFYKLELKSDDKVLDTYFARTDKDGNVTDVLNFPALLVSDESYSDTAREKANIAFGWSVDGINGIKEWIKSDENGALKGKIETSEISHDDWHKAKFKWYKNEKMAAICLEEKGYQRAWEIRRQKSADENPRYTDIDKFEIRELRLARIDMLTQKANDKSDNIKIDKDEMHKVFTQGMLKEKFSR